MNALMHYGTLWGLILSGASVAAAVMLQQRQTNATIYLELTARLAQLFRSLSIEVRAAAIGGDAVSEEHRAELSVASYEYFSLVCSAYQLTGDTTFRDVSGSCCARRLNEISFRQWRSWNGQNTRHSLPAFRTSAGMSGRYRIARGRIQQSYDEL